MIPINQRIILDLCGGTGAWSRPYKEAGYDVRNITLPDYDVRAYAPPEDVYGILAAPPCREFSLCLNMKNCFMRTKPKRDIKKGLVLVNACLWIINDCKPLFYVIENPCGLLSNYLGKPNYIFQPWEFGDPWTKRTALWGKFNKPQAEFNNQAECINALDVPIKQYFRIRKISAHIRKGKQLPSRADMDKTSFKFTGMREQRSAFRAITPPGFAKAFFESNR